MQATRTLARPARKPQAKPRPPVLVLLRAALWGVLASLGLVVLYAVALRQNWLGTDTMGAATTAIKVALRGLCRAPGPPGHGQPVLALGDAGQRPVQPFGFFALFPAVPDLYPFPGHSIGCGYGGGSRLVWGVGVANV